MSSCTNPITYCFMNKRFRLHFFALFRCKKGASMGHGTNGTMAMPSAACNAFVSTATNEPESEQLTATVNRDIVECNELTAVSKL